MDLEILLANEFGDPKQGHSGVDMRLKDERGWLNWVQGIRIEVDADNITMDACMLVLLSSINIKAIDSGNGETGFPFQPAAPLDPELSLDELSVSVVHHSRPPLFVGSRPSRSRSAASK